MGPGTVFVWPGTVFVWPSLKYYKTANSTPTTGHSMKGHLQAPQAGHGGAELGPSGGARVHGGVLHSHGPHPLSHSAAVAGGQEPARGGGSKQSGWSGSRVGGRARAVAEGGAGRQAGAGAEVGVGASTPPSPTIRARARGVHLRQVLLERGWGGGWRGEGEGQGRGGGAPPDKHPTYIIRT